MKTISNEIKEKVEKYLKENECAISVTWGGADSCTTFDADGNAIEDFMIDIEEDGCIYYTPVSYSSVTLRVE